MKTIKHELQDIIIRNGQKSSSGQLEKVYDFLRRNADAGAKPKKQEYIKHEEEKFLIALAHKEGLIYHPDIQEDFFISAGAEQRVYRYGGFSVLKVNSCMFYEYWLDYFISLLLHNYFFKSTAYEFLGFKIIESKLFAIVKQEFIVSDEITNIADLKLFMNYNGFINTRNNDYISNELGIILEDLHDENVLTNDGLLYFIDTVFYITPDFYR